MIQNALNAWWLIVPLTAITAILELFVPFTGEQAKGQSRGGTFGGFIIGGLLFGVLAIQVYLWMQARWPANAVLIYRWTALGLTLVLSVAAVAMHWVVKNWTAPTLWIVMNVLWGAGYAWFVPGLFG